MGEIQRLKRWVCILFALVVTISGMCFELIKTDPFFCCTRKKKYTKISYVSSDLKQNRDWCTAEFLGDFKGHGKSLSCVRYKPLNNVEKVFIADSNVFLLFQKNLYKTEVFRKYLCESIENSLYSIVCYIHHQDGAKVRLLH